jgi:hypothetical protein
LQFTIFPKAPKQRVIEKVDNVTIPNSIGPYGNSALLFVFYFISSKACNPTIFLICETVFGLIFSALYLVKASFAASKNSFSYCCKVLPAKSSRPSSN